MPDPQNGGFPMEIEEVKVVVEEVLCRRLGHKDTVSYQVGIEDRNGEMGVHVTTAGIPDDDLLFICGYIAGHLDWYEKGRMPIGENEFWVLRGIGVARSPDVAQA